MSDRGGQICPPPHLSRLRRWRRWPEGAGSAEGGRSLPPFLSLSLTLSLSLFLSLSLCTEPPARGFLDFLAGEGRSALPLASPASGGGGGWPEGVDRPEEADPPSFSLLDPSFSLSRIVHTRGRSLPGGGVVGDEAANDGDGWWRSDEPLSSFLSLFLSLSPLFSLSSPRRLAGL